MKRGIYDTIEKNANGAFILAPFLGDIVNIKCTVEFIGWKKQ